MERWFMSFVCRKRVQISWYLKLLALSYCFCIFHTQSFFLVRNLKRQDRSFFFSLKFWMLVAFLCPKFFHLFTPASLLQNTLFSKLTYKNDGTSEHWMDKNASCAQCSVQIMWLQICMTPFTGQRASLSTSKDSVDLLPVLLNTFLHSFPPPAQFRPLH